ncbi:synaptotagmin-3-like isoform X3 [Malania oleifera]|uniref:synaptotagmin-3-like isoform X3 n=1 Tax=Malania oleifera TaxID=397392 RepID=UPI0025AE7563|nr:synaptotagmin-3-like isoform X3 [Malania oleifera]
MGFVSSLLGIIGFGLGIPFGLLFGFFFFMYCEPRNVKAPIIRPLRELDAISLLDLLPDIPLWVKNPDYDRVDWLNKFIFDMWPYLDKAVCGTIRSMAEPIFSEYIGKFHINSIDFESMSLGTLPPTVHGIKVQETNENELVIEPAVRWAGNPSITLVLKLLSLPITIQEQIRKQVASLYLWPQTLEIPILDASVGAIHRPVGILHVTVLCARKLLKMDLLGTSDPYVELSLSGERLPAKKTSIKMKNLNPEWNEHFNLIVKDPQAQILQLRVFDWEKVGTHDKLGMQVVPLKYLSPCETKKFTLDLLKITVYNDPQNKKPRGQIVVEMAYNPFREDNKGYIAPLDASASEANTVKRKSRDKSFHGAGLLLVNVQGAEDVEGKHQTNPYALIHFRGEQRKTQIIKKTRKPCWNEEFEFMLEGAPLKERIHIEVMSKRRSLGFRLKESLGHVDINLTDVVYNGRINEKYHLINSKNGVIRVEIRWKVI